MNQLSQTKLGLTTTNYGYDQNGNQNSEVTAGFAKEFEYDIDNRLTKVSTGTAIGSTPNVINTNTYRGDGQRISKTDKGVKTDYVYQGGTVLYTNNSNGDRTSFNYYSPDGGIIASKRYQGAQIGKYISYTKDIRTSTSTLLDDDGAYLSSYTYSDFGETTRIGNAAIPNEICYTGGVYDEATALYYLNARHYDPATSRMLTQDTYRGKKEDPNSLHLYSYCQNDPVNYNDPTGHTRYTKKFECIYGKKTIFRTSFFATIEVDINTKNNKFTNARIKDKGRTPGCNNAASYYPTRLKSWVGSKKKVYKAQVAWGYVNALFGGKGYTGYFIIDIKIRSNRKYDSFMMIYPARTYKLYKWGQPDMHIYNYNVYKSGKL